MWFILQDGLLGISMDELYNPSVGDWFEPSDEVADPGDENVDGVRLMIGRPSSSPVTSAFGTGLVSSSHRNGTRRRFDRARVARNDCLAGEVTAKEPSTSEFLRIAAGT
jgi:hypothetical protein